MSDKIKCLQCGREFGHQNPINTERTGGHPPIGWDELFYYEFGIYPCYLAVITSADRDSMAKAVKTFGEMQGDSEQRNIEDILRDMGFVAMAASKPENPEAFIL